MAPPFALGTCQVRATEALRASALKARGALGATTGALSRLPEYTNLFGDKLPALPTRPVVAFSTRAREMASTVAVGVAASKRAATPATCGDAIEVPDHVALAVSEPLFEEVIASPGAKMSRHEPKFENVARTSVAPVAPTVTALAALAGEYRHALTPSFPAATTNTTPSATPRATAAFNAVDEGPPRLILATAGTPA